MESYSDITSSFFFLFYTRSLRSRMPLATLADLPCGLIVREMSDEGAVQ